MTNNDLIARAGEIIAQKAAEHGNLHCVLALIDKNGYPTASTITVSSSRNLITDVKPISAFRLSGYRLYTKYTGKTAA